MQLAAVDFDEVTFDDGRLVVTGNCPSGTSIRLAPRQYRARPQWTEIDLVTDAGEAAASGSEDVAFRAELDIDGLWGHEGVCVVGATRRHFMAGSSDTAGTRVAATGADVVPPDVERPTAEVLVTTILRISPDAVDEVTEALGHHPLAIGGLEGWLAAWCAFDRDRCEVVVHSHWTDEVSYRRAFVSKAFHDGDLALVPHLVDDSDTLVADMLSTR